jgi:acyl carrier protein
MELLERGESDLTAAALRQVLEQATGQGVEPEELWALERNTGYTVRVGWSAAGDEGCYEVWCVAKQNPSERRWAWCVPAEPAHPLQPWQTYANEVRGQITQQQLAQQLRIYLRERLPEYMVPAQFVWMERLPLTPSGKLDRRALPTPGQHGHEQSGVYIAPRGELEEQIAAIWSQVLGVERISVDTNFFDLGGHSLLATQVISRLSGALHFEVPLRLMFERPTVSGLTESINTLRTSTNGTQSVTITPIRSA